MPRTGTATLPLHFGRAPHWLFSRMTLLAREIITALASEISPEGHEKDLGLFIAGGKGSKSRKTPDEIRSHGERYSIEPEPLVYASRMSAKVDNTAVQDGYQLYHHVFLFTDRGHWAVVQQGMSESDRTARRYHWLGDDLDDFVREPHKAVCCDRKSASLNMVASESGEARQVSVDISKEHPEKLKKDIQSLPELELARRHNIKPVDINVKRIRGTLLKTYEHQPEDFEALLGIRGVGPKTIRALCLVSELIYGKAPSYSDPARYSFAHGGKDGTPFPVDRKIYDRTIEIMKKAVQSSKIGNKERLHAVRRLARYYDI
jgi:hypothetical protein